ncbi:MAG: cation transporter, partial [Lachnospiraceae bacterium]|nr:cation transporter [Lachnospiraceae bacterium]
GAVGIFLNILLFAGKLTAGLLSGSIAIIADAVNNLSDAGSSVITLFGFKMAASKPDSDHPYGHGRMEYISGLLVSILILFMAYELIKTSIDKIIHPEPITATWITVLILVVSILTKFYMFFYQKSVSRKISSAALKATATDSISDTVATGVVLLSSLAGIFLNWNIDGYCGILVGLFIVYSGIQAIKETISPLLGQAPDPELVEEIRNVMMDEPAILGIHDLMIHDYGPSRVMVSLHAEVSASSDFLEMHDIIDNLERHIRQKLGCFATIHMDPVLDKDEETQSLKRQVTKIITGIDDKLSIHDFRVVKGPSHTNLIFDVVKPYSLKLDVKDLDDIITYKIRDWNENYYCVIEYDEEFCTKK